MTYFLPMTTRQMQSGKAVLLYLTLAVAVMPALLHAQTVDLQISNLSLTPGDETAFDYSFTVTNAGSASVQGYVMKLTFSRDEVIDGPDYFSIVVPADAATQFIGGNQSSTVAEHYEAGAVNKYLPSGTWYVIAEINHGHAVEETDFTNNIAVSVNTITIAPYTIEFLEEPTISGVTHNSFTITPTFDGHIYQIYYKYHFDALPAPDESELMSSSLIFSGQPEVVVTGLGPAQGYDVYFLGESIDGNITAIHKIHVITTGSAVPTVEVPAVPVTLSPVAVGQPSYIDFVYIHGYYLTGPVTVAPSTGFIVSKDDITYSDQVTYPAADFTNGAQQLVFVKAGGFDSPGNKSGTLTFSSPGAASQEVMLSVKVYSPYASDFEGASTIEESGWMTYSVQGTQVWSLVDLDETSANQRATEENMAMQIDGTIGGAEPNEDWLISPEVDLSGFTLTPILRFRSYASGAGEPLVLKYSADYPGSGDPREFTWFDAKAAFPVSGSASWKNTMVELLSQDKLRLAFVYTSTAEEGARWTIDDWRITDNLVNIPDDILTFDNVSVGSASDPQVLLVSVGGFGSITVTASEEFQVSSDGVVFSPAVVIPEKDIATGISLRVRFVPKYIAEEKFGTLTFTASDFSVVRNTLIGRAGLTTAVEQRYSRGLLYPNPTEGDVHIDITSLEETETSMPVWIANSMGSRVAAFDAPVSALDHKLSGIFTNLAPGVYFVTIKGRGTTYRTKLIRK